MCAALSLLLVSSVASTQIWEQLDPDMRGVLYAPFVWDKDPNAGDDLYSDAHK